MIEKFIALRRSPHKEAATQATHSVAESRTVMVEAAQQPNTTEQLEHIGLEVLDPCEHNADGDNSLWPLCYLDAYVIEADDPQVARKARKMLEPDYMIVPNAELALAAPARGRLYQRLPKRRSHVAGCQRRCAGPCAVHSRPGNARLHLGYRCGCGPH